MSSGLGASNKTRKVAYILAGVAAVYLLLALFAIAGIMIDGPTTIKSFPAGSVPEECQSIDRNYPAFNSCVERLTRAQEDPDWPMRLVVSGGVAVAASFFFSVVLGLGTIVGRLSR